jgi:hypothetical protein
MASERRKGTRPEALNPDHPDDIAFGLEHPPMQIRGARQLITREPCVFQQCGNRSIIRGLTKPNGGLHRRHHYAQQPDCSAFGSLFAFGTQHPALVASPSPCVGTVEVP